MDGQIFSYQTIFYLLNNIIRAATTRKARPASNRLPVTRSTKMATRVAGEEGDQCPDNEDDYDQPNHDENSEQQ
jgi:hypothetical protein